MNDTVRNRAIGERIRTARKRRGIMQRELAEAVGVATITLQQYELGALGVPDDRLARVAAALAEPLADLVDGVPLADLSGDEVALVCTLRALPAEGRAYIGRLMADLARGEVAR